MVLVPTLHSFGHSPSHLWQNMLVGTMRWHELWIPVGLLRPPHCPKLPPSTLRSPAAITGETWRALGQAAALVDAESGGAARHRAQAGTALGCDAAPGLLLVGAWRAGSVAGTLEVQMAAGYASTRVFGPAAAPQTFRVAARAPCCAGQPLGAGTHCGQRAVLDLTHSPSGLSPFSSPDPNALSPVTL